VSEKPSVRVARIRIRNILGLEDLDVEPGALTVVSGGNGRGKSSVLEAIKAVVGGGQDATLLRRGAEQGEVVLELDSGVTLAKRVTEKGAYTSVTHPDFGSVSKPQGYIDSLVDALGFSPVAFLTADAKQRTRYLLESMPLEISAADLQEALGDLEVIGVSTQGHALEVIERVGKRLYDERTGVNRSAKEKRATVQQLGASIPAEASDEAALREHAQVLATELAGMDERRTAAVGAETQRVNAGIAALREEAEREIERIRSETAAAIRSLEGDLHECIREYDAKQASRREAISAQTAEVRARLEESARHQNTREIIAKQADAAADLEALSADISAALGRLEDLKVRLLSSLPIPGVEVVDGEILLNGVPFSRANTAERVKLAMGIAGQRAKRAGLPLVCVDGLECLDQETFDLFRKNAPASGLQLVVTRVTEGALRVETVAPAKPKKKGAAAA
jgi:hypothetical protein